MSYLWWYAFITLHLACLLTYIEKEVYNDTRLNESIQLHRRYRCKKPPFFRRNQLPYRRQQYRGRFSGTTYSSEIIGVTYKTGETLQDHQNSDTAAWETDGYFHHDFLADRPYWKLLPFTGAQYGKEFDYLCEVNPDLISLFGNDFKFGLGFSNPKQPQSVVADLAFHLGSDVLVDLMQATKLSDVFRFQATYHVDNHGSPIIFDSGASISITPHKDDFIEFSNKGNGSILNGVTEQAICKGTGKVKFSVLTDTGEKRDLVVEALYVPKATIRLLSVQRYCLKVRDGARFQIDKTGCKFEFSNFSGGGQITFDLESNGMLPQTSMMKQWGRKLNFNPRNKAFTVVSSDNLNLDTAQKVLLEWHWKLGHYNMTWIQYLIRKGIIETRVKSTTTVKCHCAACQLGKQVRLNEGTVNEKIRTEKDGALKKGILAVGGKVSTDQFVSSVPSRLPHTYGKEKESEQYVGGTIFIDEASEFFYVENQVSLRGSETVRAKMRFEREAV